MVQIVTPGKAKSEQANAFKLARAGSGIPADWPEPLDLEALAEREPEPPQSIMEGLPVGYATATFGHGGVGKSLIELTRTVCISAGVSFFGLPVQRRRVLFLSCEDRQNVLHYRLRRICKFLDIDLGSLRGWLEVLDLVGHECVLFTSDPTGRGNLTLAYGALVERMRQQEPEVLFVDGIADTYGDSENARGPVKRFVNSLLSLIPAETGAVVLIGHVDKTAARNGETTEGYSGSTSWHNSCRARWYAYPETEEDEDSHRRQRTGKLIFELQKSNLSEIGTKFEFVWDQEAHMYVGRLASESQLDRRHRDREEQGAIRRALEKCDGVPAATTGQRTAYHVLAVRPEFPDTLRGGGRSKTRRFWRHVEQLRGIGHIREGSIRRTDRHWLRTIELTPEGVRACGQ